MGENIRESKEIARMSKWLATINKNTPIDFTWDELKYTDPDFGKLIEIYTELEFNQFIKQLEDAGGGGSIRSSKQQEGPLSGLRGSPYRRAHGKSTRSRRLRRYRA
jgi:5'-3' exonuclease